MYDQRDTNGTGIRAVAGNFLFSTGANEFAICFQVIAGCAPAGPALR